MLPVIASLIDVDPRGPIANLSQKRPVVSTGRVEVRDFRFDPQSIPPMPGKANWIWLKGSVWETMHPVAAQFRKEFALPSKPVSAKVWFSADAHARIYVNGHLAARGPDDGGQDYPGTQTGKWFVNYRDLAPFFHKGRNVLAAEVFNSDAMLGRYNTTGHGGLLLEASLQFSSGKSKTIKADESWKGREGKEWKFAEWMEGQTPRPKALQFDGTQELVGWRSPGFDDSRWSDCAAESAIWPPLVQSEIPARMEATYPWHEVLRPTPGVRQERSEVHFDREGSCAVRFDRVLSGFIGLRLRGKAGTVLAIEPNEPNEPGFHRLATVRLSDGEQVLELPFYDSFSVINLVAAQVTGPLEILDVRANFVAQPVTYRGSFSCSDANLNKIWDDSRWLTEICQQTHHLDSPHHQEPICDPGDYLIISLNNYYSFGQPWLARQDLRKYGWLLQATKFQPFHTSYALLWLQMLMQYEDFTGDVALVKELSPTVHRLLDQFESYRGKNGLVSEAPDYMFMDWVTIGGFEAHHPPAVIGQGYMTAFYYRALSEGIRIARSQGDSERISRYQRERDEIRTAYDRDLWDESKGLYRDGKPFVTSVKPGDWLPADTQIETHSTQNNVLAVLYDLAPHDRQAPIMRQLLSGNLNTQPYFMHFVFDAIDHAGLFNEYGIGQMRRWKIESDTQSFREMWGSGDYSHGWQCTPLYQMSSKILGVTPGSPGFDTIHIRPEVCDLTWAEGIVPTPHGDVKVSWKQSSKAFTMTVSVPVQTSANVDLGMLGLVNLSVDGRSHSLANLKLGPGVHNLKLDR